MKVKKLFKDIFFEEQKKSDRTFPISLEDRILSKIEREKNQTHQSLNIFNVASFKYAAAFAVMVLIILGISSLPIVKKNTYFQVSAQQVIENTYKTLKNVDRIHYKIYYGGKPYEKPLTPELATRIGFQGTLPRDKTYEFWYDFKNKITRVETPEYSDNSLGTPGSGKTVRIEKKIDSQDSALLYTYIADGQSKQGLFQDYHGIRAYADQHPGMFELNAPRDPRKQFENLLTLFKNNKGAQLETIKIDGKDYYQLNLQLSYDDENPMRQLTGYTLIIEKETYRPYKEIQSYDKGQGTIELTYQEVDSDFDDSIFGPVPPKGYTIAQNPKMRFTSRLMGGPILLNSCERDPLVDPKEKYYLPGCTSGVNGTYTPDIELFNDKGFVFSPGGISIVGLHFKLYKSKQVFATEEESRQTNNVEYVEAKSANGELVFPETEKPELGTFRKFRLEMFNSKTGEKLDVLESVQQIQVIQARG